MSKLGNGKQLAELTTATTEFAIIGGGLPKMTAGAPPDTSTNLNGAYMSVGIAGKIKIEEFSIECAFEPDMYTAVPSWLGTLDTLVSVLEEGGTGMTVSIPVKPTGFEPTGFTEDGFPTATVTFMPDTGIDGSTGITIT